MKSEKRKVKNVKYLKAFALLLVLAFPLVSIAQINDSAIKSPIDTLNPKVGQANKLPGIYYDLDSPSL